MRETRFIEQNKEKWSKFEKILAKKNKDPNKLSNLFIQVTDDLSYSRTYYSKRSVKVYLNNLAQKTFINIYKNKRIEKGVFKKFWLTDLPLLVHECRGAFRLSFFVFVLCFTIGWLSSTYDTDFFSTIVGESYVNQTIENIEKGDPTGIYKGDSQFESFIWITVNNLRVDFLTFVSGLFLSIGSIFIVLSNSIMIGSFMQFFYEYGVFEESFLAIMQHGTIEISTLIISGAAGITLGKGLLFPKTHSRLYSFQISALKGLKILLGVLPLTILAGFIEGFITRLSDTPDYIRVISIAASFIYIIGYFVWYPKRVTNRTEKAPEYGTKLPPSPKLEVDFFKLKQNGEVFTEMFLVFRTAFSKFVNPILLISFIYACLSIFVFDNYNGALNNIYGQDIFYILSLVYNQINALSIFFDYSVSIYLYPLGILLYSILCIYVLFPINQLYTSGKMDGSFLAFIKKSAFKVFAIVGIAHLILFIPTGWGDFLFYLFIPIISYWLIGFASKTNTFSGSFSDAFSFFFQSFAKNMGYFIMISLVVFIILFFINTSVAWFLIESSHQIIGLESGAYYKVIEVIAVTIKVFSFNISVALLITGFSLLYFNVREINTATGLKKQLKKIKQ